MRRLFLLGGWMLVVVAMTNACTFLKNFGPALNPYHCESGATVEVKYPSAETAYVYYKHQRYRLRVSADSGGATYSDGSYQWHTKGTGPGSTGVLTRMKNGVPQDEPIEVCTEDD